MKSQNCCERGYKYTYKQDAKAEFQKFGGSAKNIRKWRLLEKTDAAAAPSATHDNAPHDCEKTAIAASRGWGSGWRARHRRRPTSKEMIDALAAPDALLPPIRMMLAVVPRGYEIEESHATGTIACSMMLNGGGGDNTQSEVIGLGVRESEDLRRAS